MKKEKDNSYHKININCEKWTNAKLHETVEKWILYKFGIFCNLIKVWRIKLFERRINQNFEGIEFETFEKEEKCIYIDKDKNVKIDFK